MKNTSIIFFGNERLVSGLPATDTPLLRMLIEQGYTITALVSHDTEGARSRNKRPLEVAALAQQHNIPVLLPNKPMDLYEQLKAFHADIGILSAYGRIIPQAIIALFPHGIINLHPSLLPSHRGSTPIESALLAGDSSTGVSIMELVEAMDAGPVYAQQELALNGDETKFGLYESLSKIGTGLMLTTLPSILDGTLAATPQDDSLATYDQLITKSDGTIDWHKPAQRIEREIRAYATWPQSRTVLGGIEAIITKAHLTNEPTDTQKLIMQTGDGNLAIDAIKPLGKKEMPVQAFLQGYKNQL